MKGLMAGKKVVVLCPLGCSIKVKLDNDKVVSVTGNTCPRDKMYAEKECVNPERTITTTMRTDTGTVIPVKTDKPVPKSKMFEVMELINGKTAHLSVNIGDILIENVFGSNVVSVKNERK